MKKHIYIENQLFYWAIIPFAIIIMLLLALTYLNLGSKPIPTKIAFISIIFFIVIILLFYKMSIKIDRKQIIISFGIGIIKKAILISDIDIDSFEKYKINRYCGVGIRMLKNGWLYNTKIGEAIKFKINGRVIVIGTSNYNKIHNTLQKVISLS